MNWQEIAGGIMQAFRNAGVKKDVIDLQEKQLDLLTKQIVTLESEKSDLLSKTSNLEKKVGELELELERLRPKQDRLDDMQIKFLQLLYAHRELTLSQIAGALRIEEGKAEYHKNRLFDADMIQWAGLAIMVGFEDVGSSAICLSSKGTAYLVENHLV